MMGFEISSENEVQAKDLAHRIGKLLNDAEATIAVCAMGLALAAADVIDATDLDEQEGLKLFMSKLTDRAMEYLREQQEQEDSEVSLN